MRLAFVGGYGHFYLSAATGSAGAVAVASDGVDTEAARKRHASLLDAGAAWYDSPVELFDAFGPDIVNVGAVYAHNGSVAVEALRRGVRVVSDKPIAADWPTLSAIREAAGEDGVALTEFDFRSKATFRAAAEAVKAGEIGDVVLATAQKSYKFGTRPDFYRRREDYGSTILWIASHGIDGVRFVTGQRLVSVTGRHGNVSQPTYGDSFEDHCVTTFALEGGASAVVHADLCRPKAAASHGDDRLRVVGSRGVVEVRDDRCVLTTHDQPETDITDRVGATPLHEALLAAASDGDTTWYSTNETLKTAAVLLAARDAADTGQSVPIRS